MKWNLYTIIIQPMASIVYDIASNRHYALFLFRLAIFVSTGYNDWKIKLIKHKLLPY